MPCKYLEYHVFSDSALAAFVNQRMIAAKLHVTDAFGKEEFKKRTQTATALKVAGYPTILIMDKNGREINRVLGNLPAHEILEKLKEIL
jgi:thioredoxin 1